MTSYDDVVGLGGEKNDQEVVEQVACAFGMPIPSSATSATTPV